MTQPIQEIMRKQGVLFLLINFGQPKQRSLIFWSFHLQFGEMLQHVESKPNPGNQYLDPVWYHLWRIVSENV